MLLASRCEIGILNLIDPNASFLSIKIEYHLPALHHDRPIGEREGFARMLLDHQHTGVPLIGSIPDCLQQSIDDQWCQSHRKLIGK